MHHFWLLAELLGLVASTVSSYPYRNFAEPPPLTPEGVRLYLGVTNRTIPNYAMIAARDFAERDGGAGPGHIGLLDGLNDGLWCQSANGGENIGSWMLPNGSVVTDDLNANPIHMAHNHSQVGLLRRSSIGISPYQGMYTCIIPDENGVTKTLVVWAAGNSAYDGIAENPVPNPVVAEVLFIPSSKPRDTDPPEFILSIDVMVAPPTHVTCQVGSTPVEVAVLSREVTAGEYFPFSTASPVTNVNVTLRTRQAGNYQCTVSVYRASGSNLNDTTTPPINISVTGTPTDLSATIVGGRTIQVFWSAPASNIPPVAGYEVFYAVSGSSSTQSGGTTNNTYITVTLPMLGVTYNLFVVAFSDASNTLPSEQSSSLAISPTTSIPKLVGPLSVPSTTTDSIVVAWTAPQGSSPTGYMLSIDCVLLCGDPLPSPPAPITTSSTTATFSGIAAGSECEVTLAAQYGMLSSNELTVTATTMSDVPEAAPTGFSIVSVDSTSVTMTWNEVSCSNQNGPMVGHVILYTPDGGSASTAQLPLEGDNQLSGLAACTKYTLMVAAQNDAGIGLFSPPLSIVTSGKDTPEMVIFNEAIATLTSIKFVWIPPSDDHGVVVEYVVQYTSNGIGATATTTEPMYVVKDLSPGAKVQLSVSAVSAISICTAVGEPSITTAHTKSTPMVDVFSTKLINHTAVRAMWFEIESAYLDHYTIYYYPGPAHNNGRRRQTDEKMVEFPAGVCFGVIGELEEEQEYLFALAITITLSGEMFEGERTYPTPPGIIVTSDSTTLPCTTSTDTPVVNVINYTSADTGTSANCGSIIGAFSGVLAISMIVNIIFVIVVLVSMRRQSFLQKNADDGQILKHAPFNLSIFPWKGNKEGGLKKNEQSHIPTETVKESHTGMNEKAPEASDDTATSGSYDHDHVLEKVHTYSTVDDLQKEVVVLSSNPAYSKDVHDYPSSEISQEQESGHQAGSSGNIMETDTFN